MKYKKLFFLLIGLASGSIFCPTDDECKQMEIDEGLTCSICLEDNFCAGNYCFCPHSKNKHGLCMDCAFQSMNAKYKHTNLCPACKGSWPCKISDPEILKKKHRAYNHLNLSYHGYYDLPAGKNIGGRYVRFNYATICSANLNHNDFSSARLTYLMDAYCLEELNLFNCNLSKIPSFLKDFQYLSKLNIGKNCFKQVATNFFHKFPALTDLDLSWNNLNFLPSGFFKCRLQRLVLDGNKLNKAAIKNLSKFRGLKELSVRFCGLMTLKNLNLNALKHLEKLCLEGNAFIVDFGVPQKKLYQLGFDSYDDGNTWIRPPLWERQSRHYIIFENDFSVN